MCSRKVEISGNLNGKMLRYLLALNGVKSFLKENNVQLVIYFELPINEKAVFINLIDFYPLTLLMQKTDFQQSFFFNEW